jgi:hypothetical protein
MEELHKQLADAKKNYAISIRWLKEALGYKNLMMGTEWMPEGEALIEDSEKAYNEARLDVLGWRKKIDLIVEQLKGKKQHGRK